MARAAARIVQSMRMRMRERLERPEARAIPIPQGRAPESQ
jgi:hypothetical protein